MLKPTYFDGAQTDLIESYYEKLENWLMNDIAQRLLKAGEMSGTADRNIWLLEQLGLQKAEINTKLSQLTKLSDKELKAILQDAVLTSWKDDASTMAKLGKTITSPLKNERYMQVINAEFQKCKGELSNLTQTTMDTAQSDLIRMLNEAEMRVATGSQSYTGAVCEIMDEYAKKGIQVGYPTVSYHNDAGDVMRVTSTRSLESAIQTALRTSMNQTAAQVTNQYINDNGIEYVLVSAHLGARHSKRHPESLESHDWWQGKAFKIRGSEEGYPNLLESTGYDIDPVTGEGMVVNPLGLHGYNCRHSHQPWDKDLKNPWIDENGNAVVNQKESQKVYEKQQTQRGMERSIRSTKRQLLVKQAEINGVAETDVKSMLQPQYDKLAYRLREQNKAYDQFCQGNNLNRQADRIKVIGFQRQQAAKANGRATIYENKLKKEIENKAKVIELKEYNQDGLNFKVGDAGIYLNPSTTEKKMAQILADYFNTTVNLIPTVTIPENISTPDYMINGKKYDLKEPTGSSANLIFNMLHKKKKQADNFVIDISKVKNLTEENIENQIQNVYKNQHMGWLNEIIMVKDGKIIKTYKR